MKRFLIFVILLIFVFGLGVIFVFTQADGYSDPFYHRFTTPKQTSLVLGTSRAAQGILPSVLNEKLDRDDIYNYSFTVIHSCYGPYYLESIKRKLANGFSDGIFVLSVNPRNLSASKKSPNEAGLFEEKGSFITLVDKPFLAPNYKYLIHGFEGPFLDIFKKNMMFLHADGWLEVNASVDLNSLESRLKNKILAYNEVLLNYSFSNLRLDYLVKTIQFLSQHGSVYMVRLPVADQIKDIDDQLMCDFDSRMHSISNTYNIDYINLSLLGSSMDLVYTDGNHLYKESGKLVSKILADRILELKKYDK